MTWFMWKNITLKCLKLHFAIFIESYILLISLANLSNYKSASENLV